MSAVSHHIPEPLLVAYAAGNLPHAFSVVIASHISLCADCRAALEACQSVGGVVLEESPPVELSDNLKSDVLALLDTPFAPEPVYDRSGIYPGPVVKAMQGRQPSWSKMGMGVRQDIIARDVEGTLRLLHIPPGQAIPDHSHNGSELTLVLQGSFSDETGHYGVGDLEVADDDLGHTPVAGAGEPCVCLVATEGKLRFNALMPKMLQPLLRI